MTTSDRTLVLDNHDSFTWNIVAALRSLGDHPRVVRASHFDPADLDRQPPRRLVVSPGPGRPETNPRAMESIAWCIGRRPLLGICLGHQCIGHHHGIPVQRAPRPVHGRTALIRHVGQGLFAGLPSPLEAMRYHSLVLGGPPWPSELQATAWTHDDGREIVMALAHRAHPVAGLQYHPESFASDRGLDLLRNFLSW